MTGQVLPMRRCRRCGKPARSIELTYQEEPFAKVIICDGCFEEACRELAHLRPIFDAMLAAGVSREVANQTMTFMLARMDEEAKKC